MNRCCDTWNPDRPGRREDAALLAGRGRFVADLAAEGCPSMVFVRGPVPRAAIRALHLEEARSAPGVVALYAGADVARLPRPRVNPVLGEAGTTGAPPAIVNAVLDAPAPLGVKETDLPMTPERVWRAICDAEDRSGGKEKRR